MLRRPDRVSRRRRRPRSGRPRAVLPGVRRQARLPAGVRQKLLAVPSPLGRDLRQQQAAPAALLDHQAMAADRRWRRVARIDRFERARAPRPRRRGRRAPTRRTGAKARILARRARRRTRATSSASGRRHSSVPDAAAQLRRRASSVTKAPLAPGRSIVRRGAAARAPRDLARCTAARAISSSARCCASVNIAGNVPSARRDSRRRRCCRRRCRPSARISGRGRARAPRARAASITAIAGPPPHAT